MIFNPEHPFSELDKSDPNTIQTYFRVEKNHMPCYMEVLKSSRKHAMKLIRNYADSEPYDPVVPYIAVHHFDNYVSNLRKMLFGDPNLKIRLQDLTLWDEGLNILTTSCFVCASRMRNSRFSIVDFMIKHNMEVERIREQEIIISLWQKDNQNEGVERPVTAVCFLDYLIGLLTELIDYEIRCLKSFTTHKLYALQYGMWLTQFKPSVRAAAALVSTAKTFYEHKVSYVISKFVHCGYLDKKIFKCCVERLCPYVTVDISEPNPDSVATENEDAAIEALLELGDKDERSIAPDCSQDSTSETEELMLPTPEDTAKLEASIRKLNNTHDNTISSLLLRIPNSDISRQMLPSLRQNSDNSEHDQDNYNITIGTMPLKIPIISLNTAEKLVPSPDRNLLGTTADTERLNTDEETGKNSASIIIDRIPIRIPKSADEKTTLSPHDHSHVSNTNTDQQTAKLSSDFLKLIRKLLR